MATKFKMISSTETNFQKREQQITESVNNWTSMFKERTSIVLENAMKILGAIQARLSAGKDPSTLVSQNSRPALIDILAGVTALQKAGAGQDTMALKSYMERVRGEKQNASPEEVEISAIKTAGRESPSSKQEIEQLLSSYSTALQQGDQETMDRVKARFGQLFTFYQQVFAKVNAGNTQQQNVAGPQMGGAPQKGNPVTQNTAVGTPPIGNK